MPADFTSRITNTLGLGNSRKLVVNIPMGIWDKTLTRRVFLKGTANTAITLFLSHCSTSGEVMTRDTASSGDFLAHSPMNRSLGDSVISEFYGDDSARAHGILWSKPDLLAQRDPNTSEEKVPIVIIGGGLSGLTACYQLRKYRPLLLEQAEQFGGNSKGQSWQGIDYSLGAAYLGKPEVGSDLHSFLVRDLKINDFCDEKNDFDPVVFQNHWITHFDKNPENQKFFAHLKSILQETQGSIFPELPFFDERKREAIQKLDSLSLEAYVKNFFKGHIPKKLEVFLEQYAWSALGGSLSEVNAAAGINFLASEMGAIWVPRGGNGAITERIYQKLNQELPPGALRAQSLVYDVSVTEEGVRVTYLNSQTKRITINAKVAILACPKFVVKKIASSLPESKMKAMESISYRAYLVGNALLKRGPNKNFYDLFFLDKKEKPRGEAAQKEWMQSAGASDIIFANFYQNVRNQSVFTFYRPLPFETGRAELIQTSFESAKKHFENQLVNSVFPQLGMKSSDLHGFRIARWGHAIPLAKVGAISSGLVEELRKPWAERVFFAEQDNSLLPCLESAVGEALKVSSEVKKKLNLS